MINVFSFPNEQASFGNFSTSMLKDSLKGKKKLVVYFDPFTGLVKHGLHNSAKTIVTAVFIEHIEAWSDMSLDEPSEDQRLVKQSYMKTRKDFLDALRELNVPVYITNRSGITLTAGVVRSSLMEMELLKGIDTWHEVPDLSSDMKLIQGKVSL
jgi:hypothetical protein